MPTRQPILLKHALLEKVATIAEKCPVTFGISVVPMRPAPCIVTPRRRITDFCDWRDGGEKLVADMQQLGKRVATSLAIMRQCFEQIQGQYLPTGTGVCSCGRGAGGSCDCGGDPLACVEVIDCEMRGVNTLAGACEQGWQAMLALAPYKPSGQTGGAEAEPSSDDALLTELRSSCEELKSKLGSVGKRLDDAELVGAASDANALAQEAARIAEAAALRAESTKNLADSQAAAEEAQAQVARAVNAARRARENADDAAASGAARAGVAQFAAIRAADAATSAAAAAERARLAVDKLTPSTKQTKP